MKLFPENFSWSVSEELGSGKNKNHQQTLWRKFFSSKPSASWLIDLTHVTPKSYENAGMREGRASRPGLCWSQEWLSGKKEPGRTSAQSMSLRAGQAREHMKVRHPPMKETVDAISQLILHVNRSHPSVPAVWEPPFSSALTETSAPSDGFPSPPQTLSVGVPQDSGVGPLLLNSFCRKIPANGSKHKVKPLVSLEEEDRVILQTQLALQLPLHIFSLTAKFSRRLACPYFLRFCPSILSKPSPLRFFALSTALKWLFPKVSHAFRMLNPMVCLQT